MLVRSARLSDFTEITKMIQAFALESPWPAHHKSIGHIRRVQNLLARIQAQGIILVSESDSELTGMILGQITPDLLFPDVKILREIVWWVKPEARGTSAGARLLREYQRQGELLQRRGMITALGITLLSNSPELQLTQRGWRALETNYIWEHNAT